MRSGFGAGRGHLIEDGVTLSDEAVAGKVIARKREQDQLQACLAPMVRGQPPLNTYLWGPPGSGKTTLARWALRGLSNAATRVGVYVNCWQHRTLYSVLQAIIDELKILRAEAQDTNFKLERIRQALRGRPTVIILDEVDRPMPKQRDEILYGLLSLPKAGLICIANSTQPLAVTDDRVRSRLSPFLIRMSAYTQTEIETILEDRARRALAPGLWSPSDIRQIAELAAGDARVGIQTLRCAAAAAEEAGMTRLSQVPVNLSARAWSQVNRERRLIHLLDHERIIHDLVQRYGPTPTSTLFRRYTRFCSTHDRAPVAPRTFRKYVRRLWAADLIQISSGPVPGGARIVRPTNTGHV